MNALYTYELKFLETHLYILVQKSINLKIAMEIIYDLFSFPFPWLYIPQN